MTVTIAFYRGKNLIVEFVQENRHFERMTSDNFDNHWNYQHLNDEQWMNEPYLSGIQN
jgi:hypothetical protein